MLFLVTRKAEMSHLNQVFNNKPIYEIILRTKKFCKTPFNIFKLMNKENYFILCDLVWMIYMFCCHYILLRISAKFKVLRRISIMMFSIKVI